MKKLSQFQLRLIISAVLVLLTLAFFWPVTAHGFVMFDDQDYVTENEMVQKGVTWEGVKWAFTTYHAANWHPLTWLSHMLDKRLFGTSAFVPHAENLLLHAANSVLVFYFLSLLTAEILLPALVALLFAVHPIHVESFAWISERKDLLCALFFLIGLIQYVRWKQSGKKAFHVGVVIFFILALLSKPMAVTFPCVLLLIDLWAAKSEGHFGFQVSSKNSLTEKIPLFVLTLVSCSVTVIAQKGGGAVMELQSFSLGFRLLHVASAYLQYLQNLFWPTRLCVYYPLDVSDSTALPVAGIIVLICVTLAAFRLFRRLPEFFIGWCWFLGCLVPTIGLIQVGGQSIADRYAYLPSIGFFIAMVWLFAVALKRLNQQQKIVAVIFAPIAVVLIYLSIQQIGFWRDSITLFSRAVTVTKNNVVADMFLANALVSEGQATEALEWQSKAVALNPENAQVQGRYSLILEQNGRTAESIAAGKKALALSPNDLRVLNNLAWTLATKRDAWLRDGNLAVIYGERACTLTGYQNASVVGTLAAAYAEVGRFDDATKTVQTAISLAEKSGQPDLVETNRKNLALFRQHQPVRE